MNRRSHRLRDRHVEAQRRRRQHNKCPRSGFAWARRVNRGLPDNGGDGVDTSWELRDENDLTERYNWTRLVKQRAEVALRRFQSRPLLIYHQTLRRDVRRSLKFNECCRRHGQRLIGRCDSIGARSRRRVDQKWLIADCCVVGELRFPASSLRFPNVSRGSARRCLQLCE